MDQFASAMGKEDHAIFLDCKNLDYKLIPLEMKGCKLVITNTNKNKKRKMRGNKNESIKEIESISDLHADRQAR